MLALEILLDGKRVCTAGASDASVLSATIAWVSRSSGEVGLDIGGIVGNSHLEWTAPRSLRIGDEVVVRIVDTEKPDAPSHIAQDNRAFIEAEERKYYERLKAKYESR